MRIFGYLNAQALEHALRAAGDNLTRENILKQEVSMRDIRLKMLLSGLPVSSSSAHYSPLSVRPFVRFGGRELAPVGAPVKLKRQAA